jgi:hypothetical protein
LNRYPTLIDYFGVISVDLDKLLETIRLVKCGELIPVNPKVITRIPEIDKPSVAFPGQITDVNRFLLIVC